MGILNFFLNLFSSSNVSGINSYKDVINFFMRQTENETLAKVIADAINKVGREGFIDVKQGGDGTPYKIEIIEYEESDKSINENKQELTKIRELIKGTNSDIEKEKLQKQRAKLIGGFATIYINSEKLFNEQESLIKNSIKEFYALIEIDIN